MQSLRYFCDICKEECLIKDGLGTFKGFIFKMDQELKRKGLDFEGHYCAKCSEKIFKFIDENANNNNSRGVAE